MRTYNKTQDFKNRLKLAVILIAIISVATWLTSCSEEPEPDLSGTWVVVEPPMMSSRINRGDTTYPAFDMLFKIQGTELMEVDLLFNGLPVEGETGELIVKDGYADILFTGPDFVLNLKKARVTAITPERNPTPVLLIGTMEYKLPGSSTFIKSDNVNVGKYYQ